MHGGIWKRKFEKDSDMILFLLAENEHISHKAWWG